jgi:hypothetical protein
MNRHVRALTIAAAYAPITATTLAALLLAGKGAAEDFQTPRTRLVPIGSPSAVDAFRRPEPSQRETSSSLLNTAAQAGNAASDVRQAVMMQAASDAFTMPPQNFLQSDVQPQFNGGAIGGYSLPPSQSLPAQLGPSSSAGPIAPPPIVQEPLPRTVAPGVPAPAPIVQSAPMPTVTPAPIMAPGAMALPPGMTAVPRFDTPLGQSGTGGDYAPLSQPRLDSGFATLSNCRNISAPSGYRSDRILTCGPPTSYVTTVGACGPPPIYLPPPAQIGPPVVFPPTTIAAPAIPMATTQTVLPGPAGHRPLISFGQERYPVQIGQGIFGQPVAYVPGQTFRNALRYISP